jgi:hypothetical protein
MNKIRLALLIGLPLIALVAIGALFVMDAQRVNTPTTQAAAPLSQTFDRSPTGFTFNYPDGWEYMIPTLGVMVMALPETLYQNEPGPTFTVQRLNPLSIVGSLEDAINLYLERGPLRVDGLWRVTAAMTTLTLQGREARVVEIEGNDSTGSPPLHTRIVSIAADNTFVYLLITTVPVERRAVFDSTLEAMLQSVRILE